MTNNDKNAPLHCSFCAKSQHEVRKLIAGPSVYVCNECVDLCNEILREERMAGAASPTESKLPTPQELKAYLDDYVIGQDQPKKVLSVAVYNHYKRMFSGEKREDSVEIGKSNILLLGPTGSGKTLLAETLARVLNVPFAIADATTLTEAGYVGEDVESIIQKLLQKADYDVERAERGIIYIDEIDKISRRGDSASITRDVSGEGVQQALLKLIEGTSASIPPQGGRKHPNQDYIQVNTRGILFICGGAFSGLEGVIRQRSESSGIGFGAEVKSKKDQEALNKILQQVEPEDLVKYGLMPEFVGRLPLIAVLEELTEDAMIEILTEPKNALVKQYVSLFDMEDVDIEFRPEALQAIARLALKRKAGARGLRSIVENLLLDTMYDMPSLQGLVKVVVDATEGSDEIKPLLIYDNALADSVHPDETGTA